MAQPKKKSGANEPAEASQRNRIRDRAMLGTDPGIKEMGPLDFAQAARSLARNPLGIIALFILLIYGIAGLVFGVSSGHLETGERRPLIWFLVLFPPLVFVSFLWLVVKHSLRLYAPSDFREDESFVQLNQKLSVIEVRQAAAEVDPRGDSDSAFRVLDTLLAAGQMEVAKNLAKAFLKVRRYRVSLDMFERIRDYTGNAKPDAILQYRAYSLIGLERYSEALGDLEALKATNSDALYDFWPRVALSYCYWKLGRREEFEAALTNARDWPKAQEYQNGVASFYPELATQFAERVSRVEAESDRKGRV